MLDFNLSSSAKWHKVVYYIIATLNRFAHFIDIIILFFLSDYLYNNQLLTSEIGIVIYALLKYNRE